MGVCARERKETRQGELIRVIDIRGLGHFQCLSDHRWQVFVGAGVAADARRGNGKRFVVRADEKLIAFLEAERAIHQFAVSLLS